MVDGNKLGDVGFQYLGTSYDVMDCQDFVEQCLRDCGLDKNLAGSNTWFREVRNNGVILTPEECVAQLGTVPKGAFLFILEFNGKEPEKYRHDGLGNASHIGICTRPRGEGAIHSSYTRGCVAESKFKNKTIKGGWNRVGLWNQVSYDYGGGSSSGGSDSGGITPAPVDPTPEPEPEPEVWMMVYAANRKPVNLRKRPNKTAALVDRVPCGCTVRVIKHSETGWAYLAYGNKYGWMMEKFLVEPEADIPVPEEPADKPSVEPVPEPSVDPSVDPEPEPDPEPSEPEMLTVWSENGKPVKLRKRPSTGCPYWENLQVGTQVEFVREDGNWCKVNYGKYRGWYMMTKFLSRG